MSRSSRIFAIAFGLAVVPLFFVVRYLQSVRYWDDLGMWYAVYSCVVVASLLGAAVAIGARIISGRS